MNFESNQEVRAMRRIGVFVLAPVVTAGALFLGGCGGSGIGASGIEEGIPKNLPQVPPAMPGMEQMKEKSTTKQGIQDLRK